MTILDLRCLDDLDEHASEITDPLESLEQDNFHRIITPPGMNIDDPDFGLGIHRFLSVGGTDLPSLGPRLEAELRKDPRNAEVRAFVEPLERGVYDITLAIVPDPVEVGTTEKELIMRLRAGPDGVELL